MQNVTLIDPIAPGQQVNQIVKFFQVQKILAFDFFELHGTVGRQSPDIKLGQSLLEILRLFTKSGFFKRPPLEILWWLVVQQFKQ